MGAYDGAEVCELVGIFILHQLSLVCNNNNIGLYRDDGLAVFKNISGPQAEKIKKHFQNIFRKNNLNIIVKCNFKSSRLPRPYIKSFRWLVQTFSSTEQRDQLLP